jgi:nucleoside-triphosphatase THEP1
MKDLIDDVENRHALIGVNFERGTEIDDILRKVAENLRAKGLSVAGLLQLRGDGSSDCDCRMMCLEDLSTGIKHPISESRGPEAQGCHLDRQALVVLAQQVEQNLSGDTDILIINRFGQAESEGRGFRGAIEKALTLGVQVIIAYRAEYLREWQEFEGGLATQAVAEVDTILSLMAG